MAFANISFTNTFADWLSRFNQILYVINAATEGNMNTSGSLTITNTTGLNGNVSLNVANGVIRGDGGLVSNIRSDILTQNSINVVSNTTHLNVYATNSGRLGSKIFIDTGILATSVANTGTNVIASANVVNTVHVIAIGNQVLANNAQNTAIAAFAQSNTVDTRSIAAYGAANTAQNTAILAYGVANTAQNTAILAYGVANTAQNTAIGAFTKANSSLQNTELGFSTIWIPAAGITPQSRGAPADNITAIGGDVYNYTLDFDASTQEYGHFTILMPKSWNEGNINVQVVWSHGSTTTNFGVTWIVNAFAVSNDDTGSLTYSTSATLLDTGGTTRDIYMTSEGILTVGGSPTAEDLVMFRVSRVPANTFDTMAVDASLHGIKIKYTIDTLKDN